MQNHSTEATYRNLTVFMNYFLFEEISHFWVYYHNYYEEEIKAKNFDKIKKNSDGIGIKKYFTEYVNEEYSTNEQGKTNMLRNINYIKDVLDNIINKVDANSIEPNGVIFEELKNTKALNNNKSNTTKLIVTENIKEYEAYLEKFTSLLNEELKTQLKNSIEAHKNPSIFDLRMIIAEFALKNHQILYDHLSTQAHQYKPSNLESKLLETQQRLTFDLDNEPNNPYKLLVYKFNNHSIYTMPRGVICVENNPIVLPSNATTVVEEISDIKTLHGKIANTLIQKVYNQMNRNNINSIEGLPALAKIMNKKEFTEFMDMPMPKANQTSLIKYILSFDISSDVKSQLYRLIDAENLLNADTQFKLSLQDNLNLINFYKDDQKIPKNLEILKTKYSKDQFLKEFRPLEQNTRSINTQFLNSSSNTQEAWIKFLYDMMEPKIFDSFMQQHMFKQPTINGYNDGNIMISQYNYDIAQEEKDKIITSIIQALQPKELQQLESLQSSKIINALLGQKNNNDNLTNLIDNTKNPEFLSFFNHYTQKFAERISKNTPEKNTDLLSIMKTKLGMEKFAAFIKDNNLIQHMPKKEILVLLTDMHHKLDTKNFIKFVNQGKFIDSIMAQDTYELLQKLIGDSGIAQLTIDNITQKDMIANQFEFDKLYTGFFSQTVENDDYIKKFHDFKNKVGQDNYIKFWWQSHIVNKINSTPKNSLNKLFVLLKPEEIVAVFETKDSNGNYKLYDNLNIGGCISDVHKALHNNLGEEQYLKLINLQDANGCNMLQNIQNALNKPLTKNKKLLQETSTFINDILNQVSTTALNTTKKTQEAPLIHEKQKIQGETIPDTSKNPIIASNTLLEPQIAQLSPQNPQYPAVLPNADSQQNLTFDKQTKDPQQNLTFNKQIAKDEFYQNSWLTRIMNNKQKNAEAILSAIENSSNENIIITPEQKKILIEPIIKIIDENKSTQTKFNLICNLVRKILGITIKIDETLEKNIKTLINNNLNVTTQINR